MKCELVAALLHNPQIVFLDEPTIGLDVVSQKRIRDFLKELHDEDGCTVLLTSHYMQDVQELCDRVIVIDHGSIVFEGTLDVLSAKFSDSRRVKLMLSRPVLAIDLVKYGKVVEHVDTHVIFEVSRAETAAVTGALLQALPATDVSIEEVDIEDVIRDLFTSGKS